MKITAKILSIPPYISTAWENVLSLQMDDATGNLIVFLKNGSKIFVPHLSGNLLEEVFNAHAEFINRPQQLQIGLPITHHDPNLKDSPDLPKELLEKVVGVARALGGAVFADNQPHCNCPYCQIARAILPAELEEQVSDDELHFREWDLKELRPDLYEVTNPLDPTESYQVFLGTPIGCTCGKSNCEHIRAVLNS